MLTAPNNTALGAAMRFAFARSGAAAPALRPLTPSSGMVVYLDAAPEKLLR
ncbi:hypothetical protein [Sulfitobacter sp. CW3]|uniref:hypothetical protein n=1 Tax=Sulfitobacter sp. CW3 TaxID=2861965 RepID=UPI001C5D951F|nr:hypothetical protein [Sulfitobacter sp. CW3]MBW4961711.1 hypothetical protein [Sulfitobacter sp. CW3]